MRKSAARENISLNTAILRLIDRELGLEGQRVRRRNLRSILENTKPANRKDWKQVLSDFDRVDDELWR